MGVQLPTTTNRQILEAEIGEKGKKSLFKCCTFWENGRLLSQSPSPPGNPEENTATLSQTTTKGSIQSSFSHLKCHPLGMAGSSWGVIQAIQLFSQPLPGFRLPLKPCGGLALSLALQLPGTEGPRYTPARTFLRWNKHASLPSPGFIFLFCVG